MKRAKPRLIGRPAPAATPQTGTSSAIPGRVTPTQPIAMKTPRNQTRRRALRLWLAGQATILVGAGAMAWTHSFIPMALAGSAALMMTVPLVKALATGRRVRS
jgi:hypothetical protein